MCKRLSFSVVKERLKGLTRPQIMVIFAHTICCLSFSFLFGGLLLPSNTPPQMHSELNRL